MVLVLGLGIPACLFIPAGLRHVFADRGRARLWLVLAPVAAFALFMAFLAPVTYYRHYLPLLPAAAIVAACGLFATRWGRRPVFVALVLCVITSYSIHYTKLYESCRPCPPARRRSPRARPWPHPGA